MANILIIENDKQLQNAFRRMLRGEHVVTIVAEGTEALALLSDTPFDAVVSDYDIDGPLTGEDVWIWVKANKPELVDKYIFCSGNTGVEDMCSAAGIPCLLKPCSRSDIRNAINAVLGGLS